MNDCPGPGLRGPDKMLVIPPPKKETSVLESVPQLVLPIKLLAAHDSELDSALGVKWRRPRR
jgi:hypothetical protein